MTRTRRTPGTDSIDPTSFATLTALGAKASANEVIVLVLESTQDGQGYDAHRRDGAAHRVHAGPRAHPDRCHEPETGGRRETLHRDSGPENGSTSKEADGGYDRGGNARGVHLDEVVLAVVLPVGELRGEHRERRGCHGDQEMGAKADGSAMSIPLVSDNSAQSCAGRNSGDELGVADHEFENSSEARNSRAVAAGRPPRRHPPCRTSSPRTTKITCSATLVA
jgi:hypothetical protein